jgi:hypothetical protein
VNCCVLVPPRDPVAGSSLWVGKLFFISTFGFLTLICSCIDYCNSLLAGGLVSILFPFQHVQYLAARLVFRLGPPDHVSKALKQLHWLPVYLRNQFKLGSLLHHIRFKLASQYFIDLVAPNRPALSCPRQLTSVADQT